MQLLDYAVEFPAFHIATICVNERSPPEIRIDRLLITVPFQEQFFELIESRTIAPLESSDLALYFFKRQPPKNSYQHLVSPESTLSFLIVDYKRKTIIRFFCMDANKQQGLFDYPQDPSD